MVKIMEDNHKVIKCRKLNKKVVFISVIFIIVVLFLLFFLLFVPKISLSGKSKMVIDVFSDYNEDGASATYFGKDITSDIKIKGDVDTSKVGVYYVTYEVKGGFLRTFKKRRVDVVDKEKPVISLTGNMMVSMCPNAKYLEEGYSAYDNYDLDLTSKVKVKETDDSISYTVVDSSGNKTVVKRDIDRVDTVSPVIKLNGNAVIYLSKGEEFKDPLVSASDNCDGDISSLVKVEGNVDVNVPGSYDISYTVTDSLGNSTTVVRNVYVKDPSATVFKGEFKSGMIYLTFDDGPSNVTSKILDILKEKNVKATFFVINADSSYDSLIKREYDEGHTVAVHSYTHNYAYVYKSMDNYFTDLDKMINKVHDITGDYTKIIRFPGGSSNTISRRYQKGIMTNITKEVLSRGYHYFDWNVDCDDAGSAQNSSQVYNNVVNNLSYNKTNVVLMHDFNSNLKTVNALSDIIDYGLSHGYTFAAIDMETPMVVHNIFN